MEYKNPKINKNSLSNPFVKELEKNNNLGFKEVVLRIFLIDSAYPIRCNLLLN